MTNRFHSKFRHILVHCLLTALVAMFIVSCRPGRNIEALYHTFWINTNIAKHGQKLELAYTPESSFKVASTDIHFSTGNSIVWEFYRKAWDAFSEFVVVEKAMIYDQNRIFTLLYLSGKFEDYLKIFGYTYHPTGQQVSAVAGHWLNLKERKVLKEDVYINSDKILKQMLGIAGHEAAAFENAIKITGRMIEEVEPSGLQKELIHCTRLHYENEQRCPGVQRVFNLTGLEGWRIESIEFSEVLESKNQAVGKVEILTGSNRFELTAYLRKAPRGFLVLLGARKPGTSLARLEKSP